MIFKERVPGNKATEAARVEPVRALPFRESGLTGRARRIPFSGQSRRFRFHAACVSIRP